MASIILGAAGSALLGPIGGMIGGQAGSMLDNMLLNHRYVRKPSLQDLIVEASTYGLPICPVYGRNKIAGNLIQSSLLQATAHSGKGGLLSGGGGSGKNTQYYTYNVTCAVAICRGPIRNIWRIFADSKLIWDMDPEESAGGSPLVQSGWAPNANGTGGIATLYHYGTGKDADEQQAGSTVNFYFGTEEQEPDGSLTILAEQATNQPFACPAYRGIAYAVFEGFPLQDYGNRIPNFAFEVNGYYSGAQNIITEPPCPDVPTTLGDVVYDINQQAIWSGFDATVTCFNGLSADNLLDLDLQTDGFVSTFYTGPIGHSAFSSNATTDPSGNLWYSTYGDCTNPDVNPITGQTGGYRVGGGFAVINPTSGVQNFFPLEGNSATTPNPGGNITLPPTAPGDIPQMSTLGGVWYCSSAQKVVGVDFVFNNWQIYDMSSGLPVLAFFGVLPGSFEGANLWGAWSDARGELVLTDGVSVWVMDPNSGIVTGPITFADAGFDLAGGPTYYPIYDPVNDVYVWCASGGTNGWLYVVPSCQSMAQTASRSMVAAYGFLPQFVPSWHQQQLPQGFIAVYIGGTGVYGGATSDQNSQYGGDFSGGTLSLQGGPGPGPGAPSGDGVSGGGTGGGNVYMLSTATLQEFTTGTATDGWTWTRAVPGPQSFGQAVYNPWGNGGMNYSVPSAGWDFFMPDGAGVTLASIVQAICLECGLTLDQINVEALGSIIVFGYVISQESSGRAALEPLQEIYQFDMVEIDSVLTATYRLTEVANSSIVIDEADLGARSATQEIGANGQPKVIETRKQDIEIPQYVFLRYRTANGDFYVKNFSFEIATQYAKRAISPVTTCYGQAHQSFSSTLVLGDAQAASVVLQILLIQYMNRTTFSFSLPIKYIAITPGDVLTLTWHDTEGNTVQYPVYIQQADLGADNTIKCAGVAVNGDIYTSTSPGPSSTFQEINQINYSSATTMVIMETPPLQDSDNDLGFYFACCGLGNTANWGTIVYWSQGNDGESFAPLEATTIPANIGIATNVLGALPNLHGAHQQQAPGVWDTRNTVTINLLGGPPMASTTPEKVLNGNNIFYIGGEIVGAANVVNVSGTLWELSLLQRGCLGTDAYITTHVAGEDAVLLNFNGGVMNDTTNNQIGVNVLYDAVTLGGDLTNGQVQQYALKGTRMRPESACNWTLARDGSNNATITWNPRNRINYQWLDGVEQGTCELPEAYQVDIFNPQGTLVRTISDWSPVLATVGATAGADTGVRQVTYSISDQESDGLVGQGAFWNPDDDYNFTVHPDGLTITNTGTTGAIRSNFGVAKSADVAYYFEVEPLFLSNNGTSIGVADAGYNLSTQTPSGGFVGVNALTGLATDQVAGFAVILSTGGAKLWWRQNPTSNWNGSPTANPSTDVDGLSLSGLSGLIYPCVVSFTDTERFIANFGASAFAGVVPAGFSPGWPGPLAPLITASIYQISPTVGLGFPRTFTG